jgi:hypothetical protein
MEQAKKTIVINLHGGPGVGKSTIMAGIFFILKDQHLSCEMASEYAKDLVYEKRNETFKDELYIFAKQWHRLFLLSGKVDYVITDRPLILTKYYSGAWGVKNDELDALVVKSFKSYNNVNILVDRVYPYEHEGRNQDAVLADKIQQGIKDDLDEEGIDYLEMPGIPATAQTIADWIIRGEIEKHVDQGAKTPILRK